jgi:molybdopterin converting factor small subunit
VRIKVKLFANFRDGRFSIEDQEYPPGTRIADIIEKLGIAPGEIGIIMLESKHAEPEQVLTDGANLALFPLLGGG